MAKVVVAAAMILSALTAKPAFADDITVPDDVAAAASDAGVDPVDLLGAVNDTGLDPKTYLCRADNIDCPKLAPVVSVSGYRAYVRLTYYVYNSGVTASGGHVHIGGTACSYNFHFGQRFVLPDGSIVTCDDRGILGSSGWLDVFGRPDIGKLGSGWVTVLN